MRSSFAIFMMLTAALLVGACVGAEDEALELGTYASEDEGAESATMAIDMLDPSGPAPISLEDIFEPDAVDSLSPGTTYCYWRWLVTTGECRFDENCLVWYGWANRYGQTRVGQQCEYCDAHPTGICYPVWQVLCGC